jgi:hypothetical protein
MKAQAIALVTYTCELIEEDEQKVLEYAKVNKVSLDDAIKCLWENNEIDVYAGSQTESDCQTQEVSYSEFNQA